MVCVEAAMTARVLLGLRRGVLGFCLARELTLVNIKARFCRRASAAA
jgi:hypothetical protein